MATKKMTAAEKKPGTDESNAVEMAEVLLLLKGEARESLAEQIKSAGLLVTATDDANHALTLAREKHFSIIALDLDTPTARQGLESIRRFGTASPASAVVLVCAEKSFSNAAEGFRKGAIDVVGIDDTDYLARRLIELCGDAQREKQRDQLLQDTLELHDQFLRQLMDADRRAQQAEERASGHSTVDEPSVILVVDDNPRTAPGLQQALGKGFNCTCATNGGEALDYATNRSFDIALVNERLPDLSGSMVSKTLRSQIKDGIVLLFEHPGKTPGFVTIVEAEKNIDLVPELTSAPQLVERLRSLDDAFSAKRREKRYVRLFRQNHAEFLKRYIGLRKEIMQLLPDENR